MYDLVFLDISFQFFPLATVIKHKTITEYNYQHTSTLHYVDVFKCTYLSGFYFSKLCQYFDATSAEHDFIAVTSFLFSFFCLYCKQAA